MVVGAGPSGIAAALAAARQGADVLLVEERKRIGGTVTHTGIFSLCGFFPMDSTAQTLPSCSEAARWASAFGIRPVLRGRAGLLPVTPWNFMKTAYWFLDQEPRIRLMTGTRLVHGMKVGTGAMVDCTGDAGLARLLGLETREMPSACPGLGFALHGVRQELLAPGAMDVTRTAFRLLKECSIQLFPDISFRLSGRQAIPGMLNLAPDFQELSPVKLFQLAGKRLEQSIALLRSRLPSMEHAVTAWTGSQAGLRAGPVVAGIQRLDPDCMDIIHGSHVIGRWPAEQWYDVKGACFTYPAGKEIIIPDECLTADFHIPFFMAGRCMSATAAAQSAVRVVGTCLDTGCRAGLLAVRAARRGHYEFIT